ncbi:MAG: hypothetical protein WBA77_24325 [Microcoleaceae cyanobacterium]
MNTKPKFKTFQSFYWRWLIESLFSDKKYDGQFQNPGSEKVFDFDDVIRAENTLEMIAEEITYYPEGDLRELFAIFISGLGQVAAESSKRSRRYAERLNTGIANLNNASFLKEKPILKTINPYLDWIDAGIHRLGLLNTPVIDNTAILILDAIQKQQVINFSGDSHGTILLGRALLRAKRKYINSTAGLLDFKQRKKQQLKWEEESRKFINIFTFGNGYSPWVKGPKYVMVYIEGDPLPEKLGITQDKTNRQDILFLKFPRLFPEGTFEAHNMMFTIELLRQTFLKNNLAIGDFVGLYHQLNQNLLTVATPAEISWPDDMEKYVWNPESLNSILSH